MKMNLQYFAEPGEEPKPIDPNNKPQQEPKDSEPSGKTYSQDDVNKMMGAKANQLEEKFNSQLESLKEEWMSKGEERAGMNAQQKAEAELDDKRQALADQEKRLQERLDAVDEKNALAATKSALTDSKIPVEFAEFVTSKDDDVRKNNIDKFIDLFNKAVQDSVEQRVQGTHTPQNGGQVVAGSLTREDFAKLNMDQQTQIYRENPDLYNKLK
ncbi:DUF4355 domain-containing protein [Levilactobacillus brevis]|uniref:DUF4355 domain-containing protein n=1 Tax=Levilactobacillus brevis TaxID=1580 RepID=A0AA41ERI6_LEVBR|nr:DUF4355 domain-containing protein [Levilactobacillus brevis]MBS0948435.1 DUF4355 domain-containing protein [Levilactobacillus brevis]MBS1011568.1 DUF4355 domain-containing protein [Levilactobacillus brevis]